MNLQPSVSAHPLLVALDRAQVPPEPDGRRFPPTTRRAIDRGRATGRFTIWAADRIAVEVLGLHPMTVWGDDWLAAS